MTFSQAADLPECLSHSRTRVLFGSGVLSEIGRLVADEGGTRVLLVTDPGIFRAGHVETAQTSIQDAGVEAFVFDDVEENPTTVHVERGVTFAREHDVDFIVGLGGGSSMDCAKGVNFLLTNGGEMKDYWGVGKAEKPMLPMIAVPTTSGTGSEAQSFALISDPDTHQKMACGDPKAACRWAVLDPDLTRTVPRAVAAATGIDAVSHAVETAGTTKKNDVSQQLSREAWDRLDRSLTASLADPECGEARADMLLGAHLAGAAIEQSMLGAAHACANPLTAMFGITHGLAVGVMLPAVVRFNSSGGENPYAVLGLSGDELAARVESLREDAGLPGTLSRMNVPEHALPKLASQAAKQWTAQFNPRDVGEAELLDIYRAAYS